MKKLLMSFLLLLTVFMGQAQCAEKNEKFIPNEPTMSVNQIKPGMNGYMKTVLKGTAISKVPVKIIGILPRKTNPKQLIMVKVTDEVVNQNGGVAAGMSGSPVYVNNKLIGAFAYSWSFADKSLGLVTPIDEMVKAMDWPDEQTRISNGSKVPKNQVVRLKNQESKADDEKDLIVGSQEYSGSMKDPAEKKLKMMAMPLQADGFSENALAKLSRKFGVEITPTGSSSDTSGTIKTNKKLEPGSSVGVYLVWGDISMGGIGTLTAVDGKGRYLAFGHSMMDRGAVSFPLTEATILQVIPSLDSSFKFGYQGSIVGSVTQDRVQAIGGYFGKIPQSSSYIVKFNDLDTGTRHVKSFRTVADPFLAPDLAEAAMISLVQNEWGRKGEGTIEIAYKISGTGSRKKWIRKDIVFHPKNVTGELEKVLSGFTKLFALNRFEDVSPVGVELEASLTQRPKIAYIEKIGIENEKEFYTPGEDLTLNVTLRPWRGDPFVKQMHLKVPKDAVMLCQINVRAGGIEPNEEDALMKGLIAIESFDSFIKELSVQETNYQLIAEIGGPSLPSDRASKKKKSGKDDSKNQKEGDKVNEENESGRSAKDKDKKRGGDVPEFSFEEILSGAKLQSDVIAEAEKEGLTQIIDTDYYVDGILRKFIKVRNTKSVSNEIAMMLMKMLDAEEKESTSASYQNTSAAPEVAYLKNIGIRNIGN